MTCKHLCFTFLFPVFLSIIALTIYKTATNPAYEIPKERCVLLETAYSSLTSIISMKRALSSNSNEPVSSKSPSLRSFEDWLIANEWSEEWTRELSDDDFIWWWKRYFNFNACMVPPPSTCEIERDFFQIDTNTTDSSKYLNDFEFISQNEIKLLWVNKNKFKSGKLIVYVHGGGYVFGGAQTHIGMACHLSEMSRQPILFIEYRKPVSLDLYGDARIRFTLPSQVNEVLTIYRAYLLGESGYLGKDIVVVGDSAGGGLSWLAIEYMNRYDLEQPHGIMTFSAWMDLSQSSQSWKTEKENDLTIQFAMADRCGWFITNETDRQKRAQFPFSPLFADDVLNNDLKLPKHVWMTVSENECLYSENVDFFAKLKESKNFRVGEMNLDIKAGLPHAWPIYPYFFDEATQSLKFYAEIIGHWLD